jgi:hypothetical protein
MAFIEMTCNCVASFQADVEEAGNESLIIMWAQQFIAAHQQCGYMNPIKTDMPEKHRIFEFETDVMYKEKKEKEL